MALELFNRLICHGDLTNQNMFVLSVSLWTLAQKHGQGDTKLMVSIKLVTKSHMPVMYSLTSTEDVELLPKIYYNINLCSDILEIPDFLTWVLNFSTTANGQFYAELYTMHLKQQYTATCWFYSMPSYLLLLADAYFHD